MELYFAVVLGAVVSLLISLNEKLGQDDFAWKIFLKQNWMITVINLLIGFVVIWFKNDIIKWIPVNGFIAFIIGSYGQMLFKKLGKVFDKKVETFVGVNE
jgi:uncharacterized membrane protein YfcA